MRVKIGIGEKREGSGGGEEMGDGGHKVSRYGSCEVLLSEV